MKTIKIQAIKLNELYFICNMKARLNVMLSIIHQKIREIIITVGSLKYLGVSLNQETELLSMRKCILFEIICSMGVKSYIFRSS